MHYLYAMASIHERIGKGRDKNCITSKVVGRKEGCEQAKFHRGWIGAWMTSYLFLVPIARASLVRMSDSPMNDVRRSGEKEACGQRPVVTAAFGLGSSEVL